MPGAGGVPGGGILVPGGGGAVQLRLSAGLPVVTPQLLLSVQVRVWLLAAHADQPVQTQLGVQPVGGIPYCRQLSTVTGWLVVFSAE